MIDGHKLKYPFLFLKKLSQREYESEFFIKSENKF